MNICPCGLSTIAQSRELLEFDRPAQVIVIYCEVLSCYVALFAVSIDSFSRIVTAYKKPDLIYIENIQCVHFRTVDFESMEII